MSFHTIVDKTTLANREPTDVVPHSPGSERSQGEIAGFDWRRVRRVDWMFVVLPLTTLLTLFISCLTLGADVPTARLFFCPLQDCWVMGKHQPWQWFYECGCVPPLVLGITGIVIAVASFLLSPLRRGRRLGLFLAITLTLGPGLLVNGILKPYVGRPRPSEITTFGGEKQFALMGSNSCDYICKSFPSGHASMGFYFMTPALFFYRCRPRLAGVLLLGGATYGSLVGFARIVQGAHYLSDVVGAALCVYATGLFVLATFSIFEHYRQQFAGASPAAETATVPFPRGQQQPAGDEALAA